MAKKTKKAVKTKKKAAAKKSARKKPVARKPAKVPAKKKAAASKPAQKSSRKLGKLAPGKGYQPAPNEKLLGLVDDYFSHVEVIALFLKDPLAVGNVIHVHGHTTDFTIPVESLQIDHRSVQSAKKGDSIGIKVTQKSRKGDRVYRVD